MTEGTANAVFDTLVAHAGADESTREEFVYHLTHGCEEFRFQGSLGFGGKLYVEPIGLRVGYYPEDHTPERDLAVEKTNAALAAVEMGNATE